MGGDFDNWDKVTNVEPLLMIPPPSWVLKKVHEVRKILGLSFKGMEQSVENFF